MNKILSVFISIIMLFSFVFPFTALANEGITVTIGSTSKVYPITSNDIYSQLKSAFSYCKKQDKYATITVPDGEYIVSKSLSICDNATLDLSGVTLLNSGSGHNIFISKQKSYAYNGSHDFTILNGTLSYDFGYIGTSCLLRLAHSNNIKIIGTTFSKNRDSHLAEIAGCNNITFDGCTFTDTEQGVNKTTGEALQIDVLEQEHFPSVSYYDFTMNQNIYVNNCTFSNVLRGVGTQLGYAGLYQKNINITNCTFENVAHTAIGCIGYVDSKISGNSIVNCGFGIHYYMMKSNEDNMLYADSVDVEEKTIKNCNTYITNNYISVCKTSVVKTASPIYVFGNNLESNYDIDFFNDNYYVGNIKIMGNQIITTGYGIRAYDMKKSQISGNIIIGNNISNAIYLTSDCDSNTVSNNQLSSFKNGINVTGGSCSGNSISGNTISAMTNNGINLSGAISTTAKNNTITDCKNNGIFSGSSADKSVITNNTVSGALDGIYLYSAKASKISSNNIDSIQNYALSLNAGSAATEINSNNISNSQVNGIYIGSSKATNIAENAIQNVQNNAISVGGKSQIEKIEGNTISYPVKNGIYFSNSKVASVVDNTVVNAGSNGISVTGTSQISNITDNAVSNSAVSGLYVGASANVDAFKSNVMTGNINSGMYVNGTVNNIESNTLENNREYGAYFSPTATATVLNNTYTENEKCGAYCDGEEETFEINGNLSKPAITLSQSKQTVTVNYKKVGSASKFQLHRSVSNNKNYKTLGYPSAKKTTYKNKKLTKGKKYYYKMRTVRKMNGVTQYSSFSSAKSIKIK